MSQPSLSTPDLEAIRAVIRFDTQWLAVVQSDNFYCQLCKLIAELCTCAHSLLYIATDENTFQLQGCQQDMQLADRTLTIDQHPQWHLLREGKTVKWIVSNTENSAALPLSAALNQLNFAIIPIRNEQKLLALLIIVAEAAHTLQEQQITIAEHLATPLRNGLVMREREEQINKRLNTIERETEIFRQIDTELSNNIDLNYIFSMIMDWSLRFTNADAASLLLYSTEENVLRMAAKYGYQEHIAEIGDILPASKGGIALRVARSGKAEINPDIRTDPDHVTVATGIQSQLTVPIYHEEKVIAVVALESRKLAGFTESHLEFVRKLANRAGVSVDNARLFTETRREREKLSNILRNIADIVIATDFDDRIILINSSARLAFRLALDKEYIGQPIAEVIEHHKFIHLLNDAKESAEEVSGEIDLANGRTYHMHIAAHAGIGRIIVMQDITYFKETDRLKTELVATVSHDLKQPLSVMRGYIDLLEMVNNFDTRSMGYIANLNNAFDSMRQLIDDLLDIARIEAGLNIEFEEMNIGDVLRRSVKNNQQLAEKKTMQLLLDLPDNLPAIKGDPMRLEQIFNNLISNAVKYTPPNGKVKVYTEQRADILRICIEDNGLGIGPEDLTQIFERFFRVRRPETDSIEGTGLGLAIVKSLVEVHHGRIDVRSKLGEGSTFRVALPLLDQVQEAESTETPQLS